MEEDDLNYRWYLPAQRQLQAAWVSNNSFGTYKLSARYWSATENTAADTWYVNFGDGYTNSNNKATSNLNRVRCVREVTP
jgi:hypothetical protein